ncbi:hypothetical protein FRB96_007838 [Tulasnella sp. 330]|nr:hypothetical protein FRB96_007838 [Tulasnella sp. 330]
MSLDTTSEPVPMDGDPFDFDDNNSLYIPSSEERMEAAVEAVVSSGLKRNGKDSVLSHQAAAKEFQVDRSTLKRRCNGGKTRAEAHGGQQLVSVGAELALKEFIKAVGPRGIRVTTALMAALVYDICGKTVGKNWSYRFRGRHRDLKARWTIPLEVKRRQALNRHNVGGFFDLLEAIQLMYAIPPENIYNMDEKGVQLGIGDAHQRVLVDRDQKYVNMLTNGNKEMVTVLETLCADGTATIVPYYIYQGVRIQRSWYASNPLNAAIHFTRFAKGERIIILCLPPHTTHAIQPEDVGVFGPLAKAWKQEVTARARFQVAISKDYFASTYAQARKKAFTPEVIKAAWKKTGISPLNQHAMTDEQYAPALLTTTNAAQPTPASVPSIVTKSETVCLPLPAQPPRTSRSRSEPPTLPSSMSKSQGRPPAALFTLNGLAPRLPISATSLQYQNAHESLHLALDGSVEQMEHEYAKHVLMDHENQQLRQQLYGIISWNGKEPKYLNTSARVLTSDEAIVQAELDHRKRAWKPVLPQLKAAQKRHAKRLTDMDRAQLAAELVVEREMLADERSLEKARLDLEKAASDVGTAEERRVAKEMKDREAAKGKLQSEVAKVAERLVAKEIKEREKEAKAISDAVKAGEKAAAKQVKDQQERDAATFAKAEKARKTADAKALKEQENADILKKVRKRRTSAKRMAGAAKFDIDIDLDLNIVNDPGSVGVTDPPPAKRPRPRQRPRVNPRVLATSLSEATMAQEGAMRISRILDPIQPLPPSQNPSSANSQLWQLF